ncbi:uncharacterized protein LOC131991101 isoform X2 [Centropristis striata]|uniref:uncharacterized protein LOC131991101 isoform X2 n=1 Tax=Centropristis striata TaxID=184440 RepID=UPI0027E1D8B2|nr:uncharacterized protein LOC131991101 isoform X2 [Centropristis striata]
MSLLMKEIKRHSKKAAQVLEEARLCTDSDIQSLTREDLHELFPGLDNFKLRREIFDITHKQKPIDVVLKEVKQFIPQDSLRAALTNNGVLVDYLHILKDIKSQVDNVQTFLDANITLLEDLRTSQPDPGPGSVGVPSGAPGKGESGGRKAKRPRTSTPASSGSMVPYSGQSAGYQQEAQDPCAGTRGTSHKPVGYKKPPQVPVMYQMVVGGQTFDAHLQLMEKVKYQAKESAISLSEGSQDHAVIFVFCPISSRVASDVEAAMTDVKGNKPVILVLMHHSHVVKHTTSMRTWSPDDRVVLHVNVFYHETVRGLLKCEENNAAVSQIFSKLMERFDQGSNNTSGNGRGVGADCGKDRSSDTNNGFLGFFGSKK